MAGVMNGLGHSAQYRRGDVIFEERGFFPKLMFVRSGVIVKALMDASYQQPLQMSLAGPGALCGNCDTLYINDHIPRRHKCLSRTEVLVVNAELLLRICDQNPDWQRELNSYSVSCSISDRYGLLFNHSLSLEERVGAFIVICSFQMDPLFLSRLHSRGIEWLELPVLPSRTVVGVILNACSEQVGGIFRRWLRTDAVRYRAHKILLRRVCFETFWAKTKNMIADNK